MIKHSINTNIFYYIYIVVNHLLCTFQQLKSLDSLIEENRNKLDEKDFDKSYKIWNGFYIVAQLETLGLGPKNFEPLKVSLVYIYLKEE